MPAQPSQKEEADAAGSDRGPATRELRADARHNRERILRAARDAYAAHGIDVPISAIARRAGVGVATLYRRFPTRASLVTEAFAEQMELCLGVLDEALEDPDPWRGFCSVIERVCTMQAVDRGFTGAFLSQFPGSADYDRERARAEEGIDQLVRRAKETGKLRQDFDRSDITLLLLANGGLEGESPEVSLAASRRLVAYLLQSFRADHAEPLPRPAPLELRRIHEPPQQH
ncbi:helix-turn-helix domain-containing protein [Streptomyces sp. NPDC006923]|uniref:TetR/AcrR family transcriptional regulator n=1 Tax=Streptomyces sp. NPDC006923 TaxID=3155355 RepID=UPI0033CD8D7F